MPPPDKNLLPCDGFQLYDATSGIYFSEINRLNSRGNKEGYWEEFLDDKSIPLLVRKCNYKDGEYDGYCEFYHSYGSLIKCNYVLGVRHGYYEYISNGVVNTKGDYKNGNKKGYWVTYYPNGKLKEECNYDNGNYGNQKCALLDSLLQFIE